MPETEQGLVHVYTGDGKGKSTAAFGLALRAAGHGWHTFIGQFMKGQDYGELQAANLLGRDAAGQPLLTIEQFGRPTFIRADEIAPQDIRLAKAGLERVHQAMLSGEYEMVILDEINVALYFELLTVQEVIAVIEQKPDRIELVLTGRRVPEEILAHADYVTRMQEVKHPYQHGVRARKGVEF